MPKPLKWALLVAVILVAAYAPFVLFYEAVADPATGDLQSEAAALAARGGEPDTAFETAIGLAPDCPVDDFAEACRLNGKIFLEAYIAERPDAWRALCQRVEGAPEESEEEDLRAWASDRCAALGHRDQAACIEAHRWLAERCQDADEVAER